MSAIFGTPASQTNSSQSSQTSANQATSDSANQSTNGSLNQSSSYNQAYPMLSQALGGQVNNGTNASNSLSALLGVGGDPAAQDAAFNNWKNSTGYQFGLNQGIQSITGNAAAKGLLNSGSTAKAIDTYGQNYANTQYQNYLNPLMSLVNSGNQAGSVIGNTGNTSQSTGISSGQSTGMSTSQSAGMSNGTSTSTGQSTGAKPGIGGMLGSLASAVATGGASIPLQGAKAGASLASGGGMFGSGNGAD